MPDELDPREFPIKFAPDHAMQWDYRSDETVWLWCECTPEMPIHIWGDPHAVQPFYSGPSRNEIQAAVNAHSPAPEE